jgi:intein-encoded DNA endonuclease-like protein
MLLFAVLNDLPKFIRKGVDSLMKFIFSGLVFSEVWELITEIIEVLDKLLKLFLLGVRAVNKLKVLLLDVIKA